MNFVTVFLSLWLCFSNVLGVSPLERFHELERGANHLSLDGGGTRGAISATILAQMELDVAQQIRAALSIGTLEETVEFQDAELTGQLQDLFRRNDQVRTFLGGLIEQRVIKTQDETEKTIEIVPAHKIFGTIFGTSIGAIMACGLSCPDQAHPGKAKFCAHDLLNFFREESYDIFPNFECSCAACCTSGCCSRTWVGPCLNTGRNMRHNCARDWTCNECQFGDDSCLCIPGLPGFCSNACCFACCCGGGGCCQNWGGMTGPRYSDVPLTRILVEKFGEIKMADALTHLGVTVSNPSTREVEYFTDKTKREGYPSLLMKEVAKASASPPTFLPGARIPGYPGVRVDGGLADNSPILEGTSETVRHYRALLKKHGLVDGQGTDADGHSAHDDHPIGEEALLVEAMPPQMAPQIVTSMTVVSRTEQEAEQRQEAGAESVVIRDETIVDGDVLTSVETGRAGPTGPEEMHPQRVIPSIAPGIDQRDVEIQEGGAMSARNVVATATEPLASGEVSRGVLEGPIAVDEPPSSHLSRRTPRRSLDYRGESNSHAEVTEPQISSQIDLETEIYGSGDKDSDSFGPSLFKKIRVFSLGTGEVEPKSQDHLRRSGAFPWIKNVMEIGMTALGKSNLKTVSKLTTCFRLQPTLPDDLEDFTKPSNVPALIALTKAYLKQEWEDEENEKEGGKRIYERMLNYLPGGEFYLMRLIDEVTRT